MTPEVRAAVAAIMAAPPGLHSEWGASGAHRWTVCAGSIALSRGLPDIPSYYATEGSVAHAIAEQCLTHDSLNAADFIGAKIKLQGPHEEIEVTEDMADSIDLYVQTVRTDRLLLGGKIAVEETFDISKLARHIRVQIKDPKTGQLVETSPQMFGRNDCRLFVPDTGHLVVYDFKHGRGHPVDVCWTETDPFTGNQTLRFNPQLLYYALGAVLDMDRARVHRVKTVELVIVQPRAAHADGPVRRSPTVRLLDLHEWSVDLIKAVELTTMPNAPLKAGEHCTFCKAAQTCPELHKEVQKAAMVDFADVKAKPPAPESLSLMQLVYVLDKAKMVEEFLSAVKHYAHTLALAGTKLPGWKLVEKRPARKWVKQESEVAAAMMNQFGAPENDIYTSPELLSVAQMEAVLKRHGLLKTPEQKALWASLWEKKSSGTVLAPEDDARPALPPPAIADFAHLKASIID